MSLQKIKKQLEEYQTEMAMPFPEEPQYKAGHEARINQASIKLQNIAKLYREQIKQSSQLFLVYAPGTVFNQVTPNNVFALSHHDLAATLCTGIINSVRVQTPLSSYHCTPLNDMLSVICKQIGIDTEFLPAIGMQQQFSEPIRDTDHLINLVEAMLEYYMISNPEEKKGYAIQSAYIADKFFKLVESSTADSDIKLFVFVPELNPDIINAYGRFITPNIVTVSASNRVHAEKYLSSPEDLVTLVNSLAVTNVEAQQSAPEAQTEATPKKAKKVKTV